MTLQGRIALVTGAGQGIGHATALAFARAGADVAAVDIDKAAAEKTAAAVSAAGRKSVAVATDVGDVAAIDQMVVRVVQALGRIDVLVNNAGVTRRADIMELTEIDRRKLGFRVEVRDELDEAGKGTHERFIVDGAQRLPRLQEKLNRWKAAGGTPE